MPEPAEESLRARALRLLARREHSRAELERALAAVAAARHGDAATGSVAAVLDELAARGWLDDRRAAEALLGSRSPRCGERRLGALLRERGIDAPLAETVLAPLRATEFERALAVWQRRFGRAAGAGPAPAAGPDEPEDAAAGHERDRDRGPGPGRDDLAERGRQYRFLRGRGFADDIVRRVLASSRRERAGGAPNCCLVPPVPPAPPAGD